MSYRTQHVRRILRGFASKAVVGAFLIAFLGPKGFPQYSDPDTSDAPAYVDAAHEYCVSKGRSEAFLVMLDALLTSLSALDRTKLKPEVLDAHVDALMKVRGKFLKRIHPESEFYLSSYRVRAEHSRSPSWAVFLQPLCLETVANSKTPAHAAAAIRAWLLRKLKKPVPADDSSVLGLKFDADPVTVWKSKDGNALERDLLLVACLRSVGIPARLLASPVSQEGTLGFAYAEFWDGARWQQTSLSHRKNFSAPIRMTQGALLDPLGATCEISLRSAEGLPMGAQIYVAAQGALFPITGRDIYATPDFSSIKLPPGSYFVQSGSRTTSVALKQVVLQDHQRLTLEFDPKTSSLREIQNNPGTDPGNSIPREESARSGGVEFDLLQEGVELYNLQILMASKKGLAPGGSATLDRLLHSDKTATVLLTLKFLESIITPKRPLPQELQTPVRLLLQAEDPQIVTLCLKLLGEKLDYRQLIQPVAGLDPQEALALIEKRLTDPNRHPYTSDIDAVVNACRSEDPSLVLRGLQMIEKYPSLQKTTHLILMRSTLQKLADSPDGKISGLARKLLPASAITLLGKDATSLLGIKPEDALPILEKRLANPAWRPDTVEIDAVVQACRSQDAKLVLRALQMIEKHPSLQATTGLMTMHSTLQRLASSSDAEISKSARRLLKQKK